MKVILLALSVCLLPRMSFAQEPAPADQQTAKAEPIEPAPLPVPKSAGPRLPDAPTPQPLLVNPKSPASPCPAGIGKPCSLLGGRRFYKDPWHSTEHDKTWFGAMKHPQMLIGSAILVTSMIADYKTTRSCIDRGLGHEANPMLGQSRAQELGIGIPITALGIFAAGKLKKSGNGNAAMFALWTGTVMHTVMATRNAAICGY
jgi:hypothetical protein